MNRLTDKERKLLRTVELEAKLSVSEIAKRTKLKHHTITYFLTKLREQGILGTRRPSINKFLLGYSDLNILFSISTDQASARDKFIKRITSFPNTAWIAEIGGAYQYALSIRVLNIHDALLFLQELGEEFPDLIRTQQLSIVVAINSYGRKYIYGTDKGGAPFQHRVKKGEIVSLNKTDYEILSGLSNLEYSSERDLSKLTSIPTTTMRRRIKELEAQQVITGYYHHIDTTKLGYQIYKLLISATSFNSKNLAKLEEFASSHPNVVHYIEAIGSWQAELVIEVGEAIKAREIATELSDKFGEFINGVNVMPLFRFIKASPFPSD